MKGEAMKAVGALLAAVIALAGCGGGGSDGSVATTSGGGGSGGSGGVASPTACTNSPVVVSSTRYLGVLPTGDVAEFHFDTAARSGSYTVSGLTSNGTLVRDDTTCSFTTSATGTLRTSILSSGLAVSAAVVSGAVLPALLVNAPESNLATVAGTYNVLRYEQDQQGSGSIRSAYATFNVDVSGQWGLCPAAAYSTACGGPTGSLSPNAGGGFNLVASGVTIGRVLPKATASSTVLVVAINDTSDPTGAVHGMWIGASNDAFVAGSADGVYVTNTTDKTTALLTLAGLTDKPDTRPTAAPILANQPVQGVFSIVTGDPTDDVGIVTVDGLYVDITQSTDQSTSFMRFGVKEGK
jgi:hypothetical protein